MGQDPLEVEPALLAVWQRQQPVWLCCGRCPQQRRLVELVPLLDPSDGPRRLVVPHRLAAFTGEHLGGPHMLVRADGRIGPSRPYLRLVSADLEGDPVGWRVTFTCNPKCGASYTLRLDRLVDPYVSAVQAGRGRIIAGVDTARRASRP
jgi:hypothetical protein